MPGKYKYIMKEIRLYLSHTYMYMCVCTYIFACNNN